jgi:hypothetical protein
VGDEVLVVIGAGVSRCKRDIGLSVQKPEIEPPGLDSGVPSETAMEGDGVG